MKNGGGGVGSGGEGGGERSCGAGGVGRVLVYYKATTS